MSILETVNLEQGMPYADEAIKRLDGIIHSAATKGLKFIKVIHGYGSTGKGGIIKKKVRQRLEVLKGRKTIKDFIAGEDWDIFNPAANAVVSIYNAVFKNDGDLGRFNSGITIIIL